MKSNKLSILLLLLCLFSGVLKAQDEHASSPYFFIQITDPQFGMFENNNGFEKETELYEKAVVNINRLKPDFVVITGDLVNNSKDMSQIAEFKRITAEIDPQIPVYLTPGNHDVKNVPDSASIYTYIKNFGYDWFSFEHKGSQFIGFNSNLIKAKVPNFEQMQYERLEKELHNIKNAHHVILFCHYPFFIREFKEPETYSNIGYSDRLKYLDLFSDNKVEAIFFGHLHNNAAARYKNIQLVTTSALGKPLGDAPSGLRIVKVYRNWIDHQYYGLDNLPDSVVFDENK
jgi:3',5'-cyclic AMP phosphodiesterase CpdA